MAAKIRQTIIGKAGIGILCGGVLWALMAGWSLTDGEAAVEGKPCNPEPTDMLMQYGDDVQCAIDTIGDTDVFRFSGSVGEAIIVQAARTGGGTPCLELFDPQGTPIGSIQCHVFGARIDAMLTKPGEHTIRVSEQFNDQTMPYGVVLERVAPASPAATPLCFGCSISDDINGIGDLDLYIFNGAVGDTITVQASRQSGGTPCIELFGPEGKRTANGQLVCHVFGARIDDTVQQAGVHTIVVSEQFNDQTLGYAVDLQCVGACRPPEVAIRNAVFLNALSLLFVSATSAAAPADQLFLTVPDCITAAVMRFVAGRYVFLKQVAECGTLDGQTATVTSSAGGSAAATIR